MRTVFTSGCFDIIHAGHVLFLEQARALGDRLVVGLNSDASVEKLKGPERPLNRFSDRMAVLKGIRWVDAVIPFGEQTPVVLINAIRPDIVAKGPGYVANAIPEYAAVQKWGGSVVILPGPDLSTTNLILKIRGARLDA